MSAAGRLLRQALAETAGRWPRALFGAVDENAARLARARALGFDVDRVYYHGTKADFPAFRSSHGATDSFAGLLGSTRQRRATYGPGVYVSKKPDRVAGFAGMYDDDPTGGNIMPLFIRRGKFIPTIGHDGRVRDPRDLRSIFAQFDPARIDSSDLLAGLAIAAPVGALTLREALRRRMEDEA